MALFKKLNEQMEVSKIKRDNEISLEERELIENEIIFNNLVESLERNQDISAMYGEHFKKEKTKKKLKETKVVSANGEPLEMRQVMDYITPSGEITDEGREAEKAGKVKFVTEDLDPEAMDNPEDEKKVKDFNQKETGATEEKEEQFEDKTEDIIVAVEKE